MTPDPIDQWLAEAEARHAAASAGTWEYEEFCGDHLVKVPEEGLPLNHCESEMSEGNARFIVEAHNIDLPRALRLLKFVVVNLREACGQDGPHQNFARRVLDRLLVEASGV